MFCCWYFSLPSPTFTALWETWLRVGLLVEVHYHLYLFRYWPVTQGCTESAVLPMCIGPEITKSVM